MVFDFLQRTAQAAVDVTADTADMMLGGEPPKREDVATLLAAGLTVYGVAEALNVSVEMVEALRDADT